MSSIWANVFFMIVRVLSDLTTPPWWREKLMAYYYYCCYCYKLLDRVVSRASFLTGGVFECDLAHCRSLTVLCMLYKIRCNPMHHIYGALPVPYVPVWVTRGAVITHRSLMYLLCREEVHKCTMCDHSAACDLQNFAV